MIIGSLEIEMMANMARLSQDMQVAKESVTSAMGAIESAVGMAQKALLGLAAGMTVNKFADLIQGAIEAQAELKKMSDRTGAAVESLSALKGVAKKSQTDFEDVGSGIQKLSKAMYAAQTGAGSQADAFAKLGISAKQVSANMSDPGQMMLLVAKQLDTFKDGAGKTALMMELFGKAGANLLPMMRDLAGQTELVGKVTKEQAEEAEKFVRLLGQYGAKWKEVYSVIATAVVPVLNDLFESLVKNGGIAKTVTDAVKELAASGKLREWAQTAKEGFDLLMAAMVPAAKVAGAYFALFTAAPAIFAAATAAVMPLVDALALYTFNVITGQAATIGFNTVLFGTSVSADLAAGSLTVLRLGANLLFAAFAGWEIGTYLRDNFVQARVAGLAFTGALLTGWENLKYGAEMAWEGIKFAAETALNVMKSIFADYLSGVAKGLSLVGAVDTSKQVNAYADSLRQGVAAQKSFADQTAGITASHKAAIAAIDDNITDLVRWELANDGASKNVVKSTKAAEQAKKDLGATAAAVTDKELAAMDALVKATESRIGVAKAQAASTEPLVEGEKKLAEVMALVLTGYSTAALARRQDDIAKLQEEIAIEKLTAARAADAAALQKYTSATQSNIEKLQEEAGVQNLNALALQKFTALRQIDKAASDAIFKTKTDEFGVTQKILAATPQMVEQILKQAQADKDLTKTLIDQVAAQKMIIQYDQDILKLKADSVIYLDSTAKELANLDIEAKKRKDLIGSITDEGEAIKANAKYNEWYQASLDKINADKLNGIWQSVDSTAHDTFVNIFNGGQDAFTKLRDTLKSTLLDLLYQMTVKKWIFEIFANVTGAGSAGGAAISALSGSGGASNTLSTLSNASTLNTLYNRGGAYLTQGTNYVGSVYNAITGQAASNVIGSSAASNLAVTQGGTQIGGSAGLGSGTSLGGASAADVTASGASSLSSSGQFLGMGPAGWIALGMIASASAYDQGFRSNSDAHGTTNPINYGLNAEDRLIGGPLGLDGKTSAILSGSALGALASYAVFGGQTLTPAGAFIAGSVGGTSNSLQTRVDTSEDHRGFLGTGAYTTLNSDYSAVDPAAGAYIDQAVKVVQASVKQYAGIIGLSADAIDSFTKNIEVSMSGLSAADQKKAIDAAIDGFMNDMVTSIYGTQLSALAVEGETSSTTLARVAVQFLNVNDALGLFGVKLLAVGINGATAADSLVKMMGGLQNFQALTADFEKNYLTGDQQRAATLSSISSTLQAGGVNVSAEQLGGMSRADVAAYVQTLDLTTAAGQKAYAAVMSVEGAFASLTPTLDAVGQAAAQAAQQNAQLMQSALANYGTSTEQRNFAIAQIQSGLTAGGVNLSADQIGSATRADARNLWQFFTDQKTEAGTKAAAAIMSQQDAFARLTASANGATNAIVGGGGVGGGGGGGGGSGSLISAFQSLTDAIFKEVERIKGLIVGNSDLGLAQAQGNFAIATAQARAGDQNAASALPGLSQAMLTLAESNAHSLNELNLIRAQTAQSLQTTGGILSSQYGLTIPSFDVGTNYIPHDMIAMLHEGEAVQPRAYNPAAGGSGGDSGGNNNSGLQTVLDAFDEKIDGLHKDIDAVRKEGKRTADVVETWNGTLVGTSGGVTYLQTKAV